MGRARLDFMASALRTRFVASAACLAGIGLALGAGLGLAGGATAARAQQPVVPNPRLRVTPASGEAGTDFTVHLTARQPTGISGGEKHDYTLSATPARPARGCVRAVSVPLHVARVDQTMAVRLAPGKLGGHWCEGAYSGEVSEMIRPSCSPVMSGGAVACPMFVVLEHIGSFRFAVTRAASTAG